MSDLENTLNNNDLKWSIWRRLAFIENKLYWEGQVNRKTLTKRFKVSIPQASADFALYSLKAPGNMVYDSTRKTYIPTEDFNPVYSKPSTEEYFSQLQAYCNGALDKDSSLLSYIPDYISFSIPQRSIKPELLRKILHAIRNNEMIEICYESFSQAEISWRWISPHSIALANHRWHLRAYCHKRNKFRDFVLGRITHIRKNKPTEGELGTDDDWNEEITIQLKPNPKLSVEQKKIVEHDYMMKNSVLELNVRRSMLYYLYYNLGLNKPSDDDRLQLVDRKKIEEIIFKEQSIAPASSI